MYALETKLIEYNYKRLNHFFLTCNIKYALMLYGLKSSVATKV